MCSGHLTGEFSFCRSYYNAWRPVTAIQRNGTWLPSGNVVTDNSWTPLLSPTPNHQEYLSTHACFGGAAAAVIRYFNNGSDVIDVLQSSNATGLGVVTRHFTNLSAAVKENGDSRVFGGVSDIDTNLGFAFLFWRVFLSRILSPVGLRALFEKCVPSWMI